MIPFVGNRALISLYLVEFVQFLQAILSYWIEVLFICLSVFSLHRIWCTKLQYLGLNFLSFNFSWLGTLPSFDHIHIENLSVSRVESCPVISPVKLVPVWSLVKKCMRFYPSIILQSIFSQRHLWTNTGQVECLRLFIGIQCYKFVFKTQNFIIRLFFVELNIFYVIQLLLNVAELQSLLERGVQLVNRDNVERGEQLIESNTEPLGSVDN